MDNIANEFLIELEKNHINITKDTLDQFLKYYELLIDANKTTNLTRITEKKDVFFLHFFDSLMVSKATGDLNNKSLLDIGSGAGFPGLPLKIVFPSLKLNMVEATGKKVDFLNNIVKELSLLDVKAIHSRSEGYQEKNAFDFVTFRAVAPLKQLLVYAEPFLKEGGYLVAMKGENKAEEEIKESSKIFKN